MIKKMLIVITLVFITFSAGCVTRFTNNYKTGEFSAKENDKYYALTVTEITKDDYNVANGKNVVLDDITNKYTYITTFKKHLSYVLDLFIRDGVIQTYKVIPMELDEISIKNYKKGKLQIVIKN